MSASLVKLSWRSSCYSPAPLMFIGRQSISPSLESAIGLCVMSIICHCSGSASPTCTFDSSSDTDDSYSWI